MSVDRPGATEVLHRGRIDYVGDGGETRGIESWSVTRTGDGSRVLTAHCRMLDKHLERWVVHTVDAAMRPLRSFVSQRKDGAFLGEGWFTFAPGRLVGRSEVAVDDGQSEVCEEVVEIDGPLDYFVPHAVAADAWITPCYDLAAGGWQTVPRGFTTSLLADGATGPRIEQHVGIRLRLVGEEAVTVPAGTFETRHFVVSARPGVEEHLWVSADERCMLVRLRSDRLATTYVLSEYESVPTWT